MPKLAARGTRSPLEAGVHARSAVSRKGSGHALPRDLELVAWRKLLLARECEETIRRHYASDEMKTPVHLGVGAEAVAVGVGLALPAESTVFATFRNHNIFLALSEDCRAFFGELYGRTTGPGKGKAGSMHLCCPSRGLMATSAVVATNIPLALGGAFAQAYRGGPGVCAAFFGDGAVEEGVFWESLNFAALWGLPVLFVCEDNGLSIHTPLKDRRGFRSLARTARTFECLVREGDGADVEGVYLRAADLVARMRRLRKPGLLHLRYFRFLEHVGVREDFSAGYRAKPSPAALKRMDPVERARKLLLSRGRGARELEAVRAKVLAEVEEALCQAGRAPFPGAEELYKDVWA